MDRDATYYFTDGACGTGKTHNALKTIASSGGLHLYVTDRREAIMERSAKIVSLLADVGATMSVVSIISERDRKTQSWSVRRRVQDLPASWHATDDVCVFITHEAMRMCDLSEFTGWSIWIDEVPDIMDNETMQIGVSKSLFDRLYCLDPISNDDGEPSGWSGVRLRGSEASLAHIAQDDIANGLRAFHRRLTDQHEHDRRAVVVNASRWDEYGPDKRCNWFSIWSPEHLSAFNRVTFLANAFTDSLTFQIMRAMWPSIEWKKVQADGSRKFKQRTVTIHYYAERHQASRKLFNSDAGRAYVQAICDDIRVRVTSDHIYMTNGAEDEIVFLPGTKLSPKQAGSNEFSAINAATCIYTVKPDHEQRKAYELLGIDPDYYIETNERETILQFMCRTSVRDPESVCHVDLFVYDKTQADFLRRYFDRDQRGYAVATMQLHDLGFAYAERKRGRPVVVRSEDDQARRATDRREADRLRKAARRAALKAGTA